MSISQSNHAYTITKRHLRSKANPDAEDVSEIVCPEEFPANDLVIKLMLVLISEREKITKAINEAKRKIDFDVDAAIASNKFRQRTFQSVERMLKWGAKKETSRESDYKFNNEGNQNLYYYPVEIDYAEAYDRKASKDLVKVLQRESDEISAKIDAAMINTHVDFEPMFDVNDKFEDLVEQVK